MTSQQLPNRFADYFIVCGLDVSSGLEPDRLSGDNLHCPPLLRPFKSKVLAHFPDSVPWNPFDKDAVGMLCLPKGLGFATQRDQRQPRFHSFIITREDGSRQCGAAFTFYEEVINKQICTAMQTLHLMFQTEFQVGGKPKDTQTLAPDSPVPIHRLSGEVKDKPRSYDLNHDKLFVTKCIALITHLPLVKTCNQFLRQLYELTTKPSRPKLPLEAYVYNLLYDVPLPLSARSLKFFGPSTPLYCQRPGPNELPLFDFSLWELFRILGVENFLQVFTCVLLEHQILLYSSDYHRLMLVGEGLCTLAFPFSWQHVYVPILPASLQHFLDAPVPYIMGLLHGQENRSELTLPSEANMCFVDIDNNCVEAPEDLPGFPHMADLIEELRRYIAQFQEAMTRGASPRSGPGTPQKSGGPLSEGGPTGSWPNSPKKMEILQQSEAWKKISSIAKKTGVWDSIEGFASEEGSEASKEKEEKEEDTSSFPSRELNELKFNNAIREVFLNRFVHMFLSYEEFVIQPSQDMESWLTNRETMQNFDKASFLSDQPEGHLPFLSPFIETQMFATLIDNKIVSQWEEPDSSLAVFDARVKKFLEDCGRQRSPAYVECSTIVETESALEKRALSIDLVAAKPQTPGTPFDPAPHIQGFFPALNKDVLNTEPPANRSRIRENAKWRRKDRTLQHAEHLQLNSDQREFALAEKHAQMWLKYIQEARVKNVRQPKLSEMSAAGMAQTNWKFVETLLKECKTKTKKMLVEKMGQEAVELGHGEVSLTGVEENTLIASLCDLLERIWSHGLQTKKGKSALWSHLMNYQEVEECTDSNKAVDPKLLTPDLSALETEKPMPQKEVKTHRRKGSQGRIELPVLRQLPRSVIHDMRKIQQISDIRTDVGMARAWVRLALEKKVLSAHFKELFTDTDLLRSLYKRYAFLRCEDEREQFLYHLLSLNAVDFFCFTNTFHNTVVPYRVLIYPSTKFGCSTTSANPWVCIAGQHGETGILEIPKGCLEFSIEHKNLGVLTTLRIGHDNAGMMPRWLVEYVIVRNELTGHTYKFPCGRWLGKGVDDGSIERLLVAELMPQAAAGSDNDDAGVHTPPSKRSPVSPRKSAEQSRKEKNQGNSIPEIQEYLGHAINNLVKHFYKPEKERGNLTFLLCGEKGLVYCMELVFQCGFRSSRLFRNKMFIWDYLERLKSHFENALANNAVRPVPEVAKAGYWLFCNLMNKINDATETIGKDGKFQIFVCVGVRDHVLHKWLPLMASTTVTGQMYEENSFLRDRSLTNFLVDILGTLTEFPITLEASLLCGLDI